MSDFFIDFRPKKRRDSSQIIKFLRYYPNTWHQELDSIFFSIIIARVDDIKIWGPYISQDKNIEVALGGRIAMDEDEWNRIETCGGHGGLACAAIYSNYLRYGIDSVKELNGNYVVVINDKNKKLLNIVTDRCGMYPCFSLEEKGYINAISSHQDLLAKYAHLSYDIDKVSIAEFLMTGKLSYPHTYYNKIKSFRYGYVYVFEYENEKIKEKNKTKYFDFNFKQNDNINEDDIVELLSRAFKKAIHRRTLPIFGKTAISLSGGLDSRAILCSVDDKNSVWSFCFFDEKNNEYNIAREIAHKLGVRFIPLKRDFDYYGDNAAEGVRISGAMGDLVNNHYLGFRKKILNLGIDNIIAGFYCDYLFKGLVLDKKNTKILRKEKINQFNFKNYRPFFKISEVYKKKVIERLETLFPKSLQKRMDSEAKLLIENKRIFPLCYEPDNQETVVPQRVLPWYLPIVDNDIIEVYQKIPPSEKLNTKIYSKMVHFQCKDFIPNIVNANTGAKVNANQLFLLYRKYITALRHRITAFRDNIVTQGSWPNWEYYFHNSEIIKTLWKKPQDSTKKIFVDILGYNPFQREIKQYKGIEHELFRRMLTLKLWLEQKK